MALAEAEPAVDSVWPRVHMQGPVTTLSDHAAWQYVLQEFDYAYGFSSSGGSSPIRTHQREVVSRLRHCRTKDPALTFPTPTEKPACAHLGRALDNGESQTTASFTRALAKITHQLAWLYGYDRMPRALQNKYAYAELLGPRGPVVARDLILGLVLFAPKCTYPSHSHAEITESYICLSGFISENDAGVYAPGSLILNKAGQEHAITTADREPSLLAYAWIGTPERLAGFEMVLSPRPAR